MTRRPGGGSAAPAVLHYGRFLTAQARHGGTRRSEQLREILERNGARVVALPLESARRRGLVARGWGVMRGIVISPLRETAQVRRPAGLYHRAMADLSLGGAQPGLPVVWEGGPGEAFYGGWAARRRRHRVVAVPQNFDALTQGMGSAWTGRRSPHWFDEELRQLSYADAIFVLSAHDRWLLSLHDLHADVLPYYPPSDVEAHLLELRRQRSDRPGAGTLNLALGTVGSEPTVRGFHDLLRVLEANSGMRTSAESIVVAGFGTEQLRASFESVGARVAGTLPETELDDLQLTARALLVHYVPAPGALTRIPEALIAGIPVVANRHAARGYESVPGVHVYESPEQLVELLAADLPVPPPLARPDDAEERLVSQVLSPV